jgi:hypothetical protein
MDKRSTSGRDAQAQRMAMKRQSARMLTEAMVGAGLSKWEAEALVTGVGAKPAAPEAARK